MGVRDAVEQELVGVRLQDRDLGDGALAAAALELGARIDDPETSATAVSACAKTLRETLDRIRELLPAQQAGDAVDELTSRRAQRRAAG